MARQVAQREDLIAPLAELFRTLGYEATSLSAIQQVTGLGKGSLYHFFPGGKEEMANAVLAAIHDWFEREVFLPLEQSDDVRAGILHMLDAVDRYFHSGKRVCLVGALSLSEARSLFAQQITSYFERWCLVLARALCRLGRPRRQARGEAERIVAAIQGALVLSRSLSRPEVFASTLARLRAEVCAPS